MVPAGRGPFPGIPFFYFSRLDSKSKTAEWAPIPGHLHDLLCSLPARTSSILLEQLLEAFDLGRHRLVA